VEGNDQAMWAAMQADQEESIQRRTALDFKITELKACLAALSDLELSADLRSSAPTLGPSPPPEQDSRRACCLLCMTVSASYAVSKLLTAA